MRWLPLVGLLVACRAPAPEPVRLPAGERGLEAWRAAHADLKDVRARFGAPGPYTMNLSLELQQQQLGKRMRARGVVAVHPPHALRMILLGPGGTTALDLWICHNAFRFSVPAIELERRGDVRSPASELRGLPVTFLRWWFLNPLSGRLLSYLDAPKERRFVLRDGDHIVHLGVPRSLDGQVLAGSPPARSPSGRLLGDVGPSLEPSGQRDAAIVARRLSPHGEERLWASPQACGTVRYLQERTGIDIKVNCEKRNQTAPPARAFADPDAPERACGLVAGQEAS